MHQNGSYITIDEICRTWLAEREKPIHTYWKALLYAVKGVRELALSTLPLLQHKILTRPAGQHWFDLPEGLTSIVSVGIQFQGTWRALGINNTLIPFPTYDGNSGLGSGFGDGFYGGSQINNGDGQVSLASFAPGDFDAADFATASVPASVPATDWYGADAISFQRTDSVAINLAARQIYTGPAFPIDRLYVVYIAVGDLDTMTHVPVMAQAAVEAYMDWQYATNRRGGVAEARMQRDEWYRQHKMLRARQNPLTIADIKRLNNTHRRNASYVNLNAFTPYAGISSGGSVPAPTPVLMKFWIIAVGNAPALTGGRVANASFSNGSSFTISGLDGLVVDHMRVGTLPVSPELGGYAKDADSDTLTFDFQIVDQNLYFVTLPGSGGSTPSLAYLLTPSGNYLTTPSGNPIVIP